MPNRRPVGLVLILEAGLPASHRNRLRGRLEELGGDVRYVDGGTHPYFEVTGEHLAIRSLRPDSWRGVLRAVPLAPPAPHASWGPGRGEEGEARPTRVTVGHGDGRCEIGTGGFTVIAGPCAVETAERTLAIARAVREAGARLFRAGAFKPRTSPYAFQGLGSRGLEILRAVREEVGLPVVTEVMALRDLEEVAESSDIIQVGSRNMHNGVLLAELGRQHRPVLLKRGFAASIDELLLAAEYVLMGGNCDVILCERGVRCGAGSDGVVLDLAAVVEVRRRSHLPIIVDPSHGGRAAHRVAPLARAACALGAHGLLVEVHDDVERALSDGQQSLSPTQLESLVADCRSVRHALTPAPPEQPDGGKDEARDRR